MGTARCMGLVDNDILRRRLHNLGGRRWRCRGGRGPREMFRQRCGRGGVDRMRTIEPQGSPVLIPRRIASDG